MTNAFPEGSRYQEVTEISDQLVSHEQHQRVYTRYCWARQYCIGKDTLEVACGTGVGIGILNEASRSFRAGDISNELLAFAREVYGDRIELLQFNAEQLPFGEASLDVIIIFEALYYLADQKKFFNECRRVLRSGGTLLISSANKDLWDFHPSPHSTVYLGVLELKEALQYLGFQCEFFADTPVGAISWRQKIFRPIKKVASALGLFPKTMKGKMWLKRLVFGSMKQLPREIHLSDVEPVLPVRIDQNQADVTHKVIYCLAKLG